MCDLEYEAGNPLEICGGKLQAFGNTIMFMSNDGYPGFAINEGKDNEVLAQILCRTELKNDKGEVVIRGYGDYRSGKYLKTGAWITYLMRIQRTLLEDGIYKKRQIELWGDFEGEPEVNPALGPEAPRMIPVKR